MMAYVVLFFVALLSASLASAQPRNGILEVRVKDDREAIGDFSQVDLVVEMISIGPKVGSFFWRMGWKDLKPSLERIDLTKLCATGRCAKPGRSPFLRAVSL